MHSDGWYVILFEVREGNPASYRYIVIGKGRNGLLFYLFIGCTGRPVGP